MQRTYLYEQTDKIWSEGAQNIDKKKQKRNENDLWLQKCRQTLFVEDNSGWMGGIREDWIWKTMKIEKRWGIKFLILLSQKWLITEKLDQRPELS